MSSDEIVVTGQRYNFDYLIYWSYEGFNSLEYTYLNNGLNYISTVSNMFPNTPADQSKQAVVSAVLSQSDDSEQDAQIMEAAVNVTRALGKIDSALSSIPSNTIISWDGVSETAGQVLANLHNTTFTVGNFVQTNGGVGAATHGINGNPNSDQLNYTAFVGPNGYASPAYTDDQGLIGILLHELGHISQSGYDNLLQEMAVYRNDYGSTYGFYNVDPSNQRSDYNFDNERFANDFQQAVGDAINVDHSQFSPTYGYGAVGASQIYNDHHYFRATNENSYYSIV